MLLEEVKAMKEIAAKIKEGWEVKRGKTQDCSEDINNRLHIVCFFCVGKNGWSSFRMI